MLYHAALRPGRIMPWTRVLPWIIGGALVAVLLALRVPAMLGGGDGAWHGDFANLWAGGHYVAARDWSALYDQRHFTDWQTARFGEVGQRVFSYPPTMFPITQLAALVPYKLGLVLWLVTTGALFVAAARRWWPHGAGPAWLAVLTPAALINIGFGQSGFLYGAIWLAIFANLDRRPVLAGALVAAFVTKPQLALLIPLIFALTGNWRAFVVAGVASVAAIAGSIALYGVVAWQQFFAAAVPRQAGYVDAGRDFFVNLSTSTVTVVHQWTGIWPLAWAVHIVVALGALAVLLAALRDRASARDMAMIGATATFLILPYALSYDLVVPAIAAWAIIANRDSERADRRLAEIGFVAPQLAIIVGVLWQPVLPIGLIALLFAQHRARRELMRDTRQPVLLPAA